jgi:peptidase M28-like protein
MNRRVRTIGFLLAIVAAVTIVWFALISMPGRSFAGAPPRLTAQQFALRAALEHDVRELSARIGERNDAVADHLDAAAAYIEESFRRSGLRPARQIFMVNGTPCANIEAELRGRSNPDQIVVIGAHYDSVDESPGADDNASGTASLLALARRAARSQPARTLRFVAFVNEEPPHFQTSEMGSVVYAKRSFDRHEKIVAMISIESIGYFNETDGSQAYPALLAPFFPSRGDFIAFAGNLGSRRLLRRTIGAFRTPATIPSEGAQCRSSSTKSAGRISGLSGSSVTKPLWSRTRHRSGTRTITPSTIAPTRSITIGCRGSSTLSGPCWTG